jgi:hypothetical protein
MDREETTNHVTSEAMLGLFREPDEAAQAVARLRAAGFDGREIEVLSDAPYPEGAFGEEPVAHRLYTFTLAGALAGLAVALLLTIGTQLSYPLVTGGKPILSIPPMLTIIFEGTMLGAIIFTVVGVVAESRLPRLGRELYDSRIAEGYLGVLVTRADGRAEAAKQAFREAGADDVVTSTW